jgi:hypothetical protein
VNIFFQGHDHLYAWETMDNMVYQEVPMPSDTSYEIGMLANADAYTDVTLDGSGHLRVTVDEECVTVDYVAAYLPEDTMGEHQNRAIRHSYQICNGVISTEEGGGHSVDSPFFEIFPNPAGRKLTVKAKNTAAFDRRIDIFNLQGSLVRTDFLPAGTDLTEVNLMGLGSGVFAVRITEAGKSWVRTFYHN